MGRIAVVTPHRPTTNSGNDVTAARWTARLTELGHDADMVVLGEAPTTSELEQLVGNHEVLITLHARRTAAAALWWATHRADRPLVVGLAGTDLYHDMPADKSAMAAVEAADALIALQAEAVARLEDLHPAWAAKTHVIPQSVMDAMPPRAPAAGEFRVVVLAHLREVKDPLMSARAARLVAPQSLITVHHAGEAPDDGWARAAQAEAAENPRYQWHGALSAGAALDLLSTASVLACTSLSEGGANVVSEAIAMGVPVVGTRIDGNVGMLGRSYPGLVPVGDDAALADLLSELETNSAALHDLQLRVDALAPMTDPVTERGALTTMLRSLGSADAAPGER